MFTAPCFFSASGHLERHDSRGRVGNRDVVIAVYFLDGATAQRAAHGQPHQQFNALGSGLLHQFVNAVLRRPLGVADQTVHELQIKRLVDEARPRAIQLMCM